MFSRYHRCFLRLHRSGVSMGSQESMQEIRAAVQAKMQQHDFFVPWFLGWFFSGKKNTEKAWICFFWWFLTDSTMVNQQIRGIFDTFSKCFKQIQERVGWLFGLAETILQS